MITDALRGLDLAQNEAKIYEVLLRHGQSGVSRISAESGVHRRNVYDSLARLIEKGVVLETRSVEENQYQAVDPRKLTEILKQKESALNAVMPELARLYRAKPLTEEVVIYRGVEGWKNYLTDIIDTGQDCVVIGAKGQLHSRQLQKQVEELAGAIKQKKFKVYRLYEDSVVGSDFLPILGPTYRFLPKSYTTTCTTSVFGDRVVIFADAKVGEIEDKASFTVIINAQIADAYRALFWLLWDKAQGKTPPG